MDWESFVPEHRWDIELCKWNVNKNTAKKTRPTSIWTPSRKWMKTTVKQAVGRGFKSLQLIIYKRSPRFHPSPHHRYPAIGKHSTSPQVGCKDSRECLCVCVCACVCVCFWSSCAPVLWFEPCPLEYAWGLWVLPSSCVALGSDGASGIKSNQVTNKKNKRWH